MLFRFPPAPSLRSPATSLNFDFLAFLFPVCSVNFVNLEYFLRKLLTGPLSQTITSRAFVRHSSLMVAVVHWRLSCNVFLSVFASFLSFTFFFSFFFFTFGLRLFVLIAICFLFLLSMSV